MAFSRRFVGIVSLASSVGLSACAPRATAPAATVATKIETGGSGEGALALATQGDVGPFLERYCLSCHGHGKSKGGLSLEGFAAAPQAPEHQAVWQDVLERVETKDMPPEEHLQPSDGERQQLVAFVTSNVFGTNCANPDPGRVTMRRLNRAEYQNTMADLLGIELPLAEHLPADDSGHGFDNLGDVLTTSPLLLERYLATADMALTTVLFDPARTTRTKQSLSPELAELGAQVKQRGDGWVLLRTWEEDDVALPVDVPAPAEFVMRVKATLHKPGPRPLTLTFFVDDKAISTVTVDAKKPRMYEARLPVPAGRHRLRAVVLKDKTGLSPFSANAPKTGKPYDGEIAVGGLELDGPIGLPQKPGDLHRRIFFVSPHAGRETEAAEVILRRFAERAFRRPVDDQELSALVQLAQQRWAAGDNFEAGVTQALRAVLVSPRFLFRLDTYAPGGEAGARVAVDDFALASRLSYFLWSSMPDDELMAEARRGTLKHNLDAQVTRMLAHPRSRALVNDFVGQWLSLRSIDGAAPAFYMFKSFDEALRLAMKLETTSFMTNLIQQDLSILDVLDANYTFANARLASHYGLDGVVSDAFVRVSLEDTPRRGVLTHGSILTLTSTPTRTSPVKRGLWVLETLLNAPPPPAPPDIPALDEGREAKGTVRQRLEAHRANPACASCHARMDPIGFGLESFDAVGTYRTKDAGEAIDDTGTLASGESFKGARELTKILANKKSEDFARAFAQKLLTYALGRGLEPADRCTVDAIVDAARKNDFRFSSFVRGIVKSVPFGNTRTPAPSESRLAHQEVALP